MNLVETSSILLIQMLTLSFSATAENVKFAALRSCLSSSNVNMSHLIGRDEPTDRSAYAALNFQWNKCCGEKTPLAYLLVQNAAEVQHAVKCAISVKDLRVVPKGGGHSYGKYSFGDSESLIVDLQNLTRLTVDGHGKSAVIGPGVLLGPAVWKLFQSGKFGIPVGACPTVGIGFVLGGGYGEFSRLHGMTVDALTEVDMVDATGNLLKVNSASHPDLFWALRGGGAGSFGIVTRFKFQLFDAPDTVVQGNSDYGINDFPVVFAAWQKFIGSNPGRTINGILKILPSQADVISLKVIQVQAKSQGQGAVRNILNTFPRPAMPSTLRALSYLDFFVLAGNEETGYNTNLSSPAQLATLGRHDFVPPGSLRAKTFYVPRLVDPWSIRVIFLLLKSRPKDIIIVMRPLGGAISDVRPTGTAFVHRGQNLYETDVLYIGPEETEKDALPWMEYFFRITQVLMGHTESYQNHLDIDLREYLARYYGINAVRLTHVKTKYDPTNLFRNPQSVPSFDPSSFPGQQ